LRLELQVFKSETSGRAAAKVFSVLALHSRRRGEGSMMQYFDALKQFWPLEAAAISRCPPPAFRLCAPASTKLRV